MNTTLTRLLTPIEARCKPGDLWHLGEHRLLCGDATKSEDVKKLMQGERFALCMTSPPYAKQRTYKCSSDLDWTAMMSNAFDSIITHGFDDCHIIINLGLVHSNRRVNMYWNAWLEHCESIGWPLFGWYIWDKGSGLPGEWGGRLAPSHEFLFHFNQQRNYPRKWMKTTGRIGGTKLALRGKDGKVQQSHSPEKFGQLFKIPDSVIRVGRENSRGIHTDHHPAVFPVILPEFLLNTYSDPGDTVYEPFCGSGTTIIAAQNQGRRCYAIEIAPEYCDLILARYEAQFGAVVQCTTLHS